MPLWKIRCVAVYKAAGEHGEITVTVPHPEPPAAEFDSEISFTEMRVKDWSINGNQGQTWHAGSSTNAGNGTAAKKAPATASWRASTMATATEPTQTGAGVRILGWLRGGTSYDHNRTKAGEAD